MANVTEESDPEPQDDGVSGSSNCSTASWRVPTYETHFGVALDTGLDGLSLLIYRGSHGWKALEGSKTFAKLSHQIYARDIETILHDISVCEICVVDLECGKWKTIWAMNDSDVSHP